MLISENKVNFVPSMKSLLKRQMFVIYYNDLAFARNRPCIAAAAHGCFFYLELGL